MKNIVAEIVEVLKSSKDTIELEQRVHKKLGEFSCEILSKALGLLDDELDHLPDMLRADGAWVYYAVPAENYFILTWMEDAEKAAAIATQAKERALKLSPEMISYLLRHASRDMRTLSMLVVALDQYTLEQKRPVTLPLLRELLSLEHTA